MRKTLPCGCWVDAETKQTKLCRKHAEEPEVLVSRAILQSVSKAELAAFVELGLLTQEEADALWDEWVL